MLIHCFGGFHVVGDPRNLPVLNNKGAPDPEKANVHSTVSDQDVERTKSVAVRIHVMQERRTVSRVLARLDCQCTFGSENREANVINLSIKGAFLSSRFQPLKGNNVTVTLKTSLLRKPLIIEGKIIRVSYGMSELGTQYRFGVRFDCSPLGLIELVNKLVSQPPGFSRF